MFVREVFQFVSFMSYFFLFLAVDALLETTCFIFYLQDMKFGGTPLHWASSREVIETLADMGCDVDAVNFSQRTPLHVMVPIQKSHIVIFLNIFSGVERKTRLCCIPAQLWS